jgi:hypothetical protein
MKCSLDDAGACFESEIVIDPGLFADKTREASGAVPAHFTFAAIVIVEFPGPIRFAGSTGHEHNEAVGADSAMPIAKPHNARFVELLLAVTAIHEDKIVSGTAHFGKIQNHREEVTIR